jgi:predicted HAD superfamily Cof-like phosphohydrolase
MPDFISDIQQFNVMYRMPVAASPVAADATIQGVSMYQRLLNFREILGKEIEELDDDVLPKFASLQVMHQNGTSAEEIQAQRVIALTALADLLGDIQVYCASEMAKFGLPWGPVMEIIMQSNFSKMGADGNPIYDDKGKLQKGPNYWKPEPEIASVLAGQIAQAEGQ